MEIHDLIRPSSIASVPVAFRKLPSPASTAWFLLSWTVDIPVASLAWEYINLILIISDKGSHTVGLPQFEGLDIDGKCGAQRHDTT